ncbi:sugar ABC transporter [Lactiplantibacillus fabifermentans T30PCM01]|uniref:Sugar ABC transporter n=1 Tax=Lactiplantibacillus fabifermentans T30PCM01 TaxID=1400520 RepID=W6TAL3_9LACO|nr:sugar ABC transporter [Lactiplantibacillus fabifermentans]ETY75597.1 sugar ABC transporter [Lactiplantibacillus fabifermentans T30PCM01]
MQTTAKRPTISFPVRFFGSLFSPRRMFVNRAKYNWFQIIVLFIFLTALMLMPIPFYYNHQTNFNLEPFLPQVNKMAASSSMQTALKDASYSGQSFTNVKHQIITQNKTNIAGFNLTAADMAGHKNVINLHANNFEVKSVGSTFNARYVNNHNLKTNAHGFIVDSWYQSNKVMIGLFMLLTLGLIIVGVNLILVNGAAVFLFLSRHNRITHINNYREAVNLTLEMMGIGSLLAMVIGLIHFDVTIELTVQSLSLAFVVLWVYLKTKFKDVDKADLM